MSAAAMKRPATLTPERVRELGELFDRTREQHGRDVAVEALADELAGWTRRRTHGEPDYADPAAIALVAAVCRAAGGEARARRLFGEVRSPSHETRLVRLRDEVCWVLGEHGFTDSEIGAAVNRERSSVTSARGRFRERMAGSEVLRKRMGLLVASREVAA